jgi:hypothetical protein
MGRSLVVLGPSPVVPGGALRWTTDSGQRTSYFFARIEITQKNSVTTALSIKHVTMEK